jgi:signal transduction histidine kinase
VEAAATRAISLVRTLNDVQTLDAGQLSLRMETADVRTLVTWVVHMLDRYSERHPIALAVPSEAVLVQCDVDRLRRVFENLVTNAIKYSPDGGAIEVSLCVEDRSAVVSVRDYGMGISPAAIPRVFERAYRAPEAVATAPGLGLGLSIAAEFVHRHGGTIEARAAEPNGTTVTVRLPLVSPSRNATDDVLRMPAATATQNVPTDVSQGGSGASPAI